MRYDPKAALWRYDLPNIKLEGWAIVIMSSDGYFSAVSDFGNYCYKWSSFEGDFRKFLLDVESDYLLSKISRRSVFDEEKAQKNIRRAILEMRRTGGLTREEAREEWDRASIDSQLDFYDFVRETKLYDMHEYGEMVYPGEAEGFCRSIWPRLCAIWKTELHADSPAPL